MSVSVSILILLLLPPLTWVCSSPAQPSDQQRMRDEAQSDDAPPQTLPQPMQPASPIPPPETTLTLLGRTATLVEHNPSPEVRLFQQYWRTLLDRHQPDKVFGVDTCPLPGPTRTQWKNVTVRMPAMPPEEKLRLINGFFNNWQSISDLDNYGQEEYWASPEDFLTKGGGDCEDYAIIKYLALRYFSWPMEDIWIVFVHDNINNGNHAVLAARANNRVFILDNLSRPAYLLILEKQYAAQVAPRYALNEQGIWSFPVDKDAPRKENKNAAPDKKNSIP